MGVMGAIKTREREGKFTCINISRYICVRGRFADILSLSREREPEAGGMIPIKFMHTPSSLLSLVYASRTVRESEREEAL